MQAKKLVPLLILFCWLAGCVTTEKPVFTADTSKEKAINSRVDLALNYLRKGDPESARRNLKAALKIDPKSPQVHDAFGVVFTKEGEPEIAESHYKKAIAYDPSYSKARNNYAAFLYEQKRYKEAMKQLKIVADDQLYKERLRAFGNLGQVALKLGDTETAENAFKRALKMQRKYSPAMLELAIINFDRGELDVAQRYYSQFKSLSKQSPRALLFGIRLAEAQNDRSAKASNALALKNLYPNSKEYQRFKSGSYNQE
ncbi:MAG: type IV pilus biogenesis/stability protein PilW [Pseudomonadales bacterium]